MKTFQSLLKEINDKPLLELKIREYLMLMTTRGRIWSLYMLSTGNSRLKYLVEKILDYYNADTEYDYLRQSLSYYESELEKRDIQYRDHIASMQRDHETLLNIKDSQYQKEIEHLKHHIEFLLDENTTLKEMLAKQSCVIKTQLEQIISLSLTENDLKKIHDNKVCLSDELEGLKSASVFSV